MFQIMEIEEKLKTLSSRVDNLENISSRHSIINNNDEQSNDVGNIQEQPVNRFYIIILYEMEFLKPSLLNSRLKLLI